MAGRVRSFTDRELDVLRQLARELKALKGWNGTELGKLGMGGVAQQNASRFVADGSRSGIDRTTANALAQACGYRDVEHALLDAGVITEMLPAPSGNEWRSRDWAQDWARKLGYPEAAINAVIHRYTEDAYKARPMRWWNDRIVLESIARQDEDPAFERDEGSRESQLAPRPRKSGTEG